MPRNGRFAKRMDRSIRMSARFIQPICHGPHTSKTVAQEMLADTPQFALMLAKEIAVDCSLSVEVRIPVPQFSQAWPRSAAVATSFIWPFPQMLSSVQNGPCR